MTAPSRIWIWPEQNVYGVKNWLKGCFRAEAHRPLDDPFNPTGEEYVSVKVLPDLSAELESLMAAYAECNGEDHPAYMRAEHALAKARGEA